MVLFCDGASRNNGKPNAEAGAGWVLLGDNKEVICSGKEYLGKATNNVAEYISLINGLLLLKSMNLSRQLILMDSQLVVNQVCGRWFVKDVKLKQLNIRAKQLMQETNSILEHIPREHNQLADKLANESIDERR